MPNLHVFDKGSYGQDLLEQEFLRQKCAAQGSYAAMEFDA